MPELHRMRIEILERLARQRGVGEGAPTLAELAREVGLSSTQTVHHHLTELERGGYIQRLVAPSRKRRPITITDRGWEALGSAPLLGRVAAGRGLEAIADPDPYSLTSLLRGKSGRPRYLLHAVGQSMTGAGIEEGDLLIVEEDESPPDGAVVVALLGAGIPGEEVTIKRLYREGDRVRLGSQNGDHSDIVVDGGEVRIQGRVEYVFHPPRR